MKLKSVETELENIHYIHDQSLCFCFPTLPNFSVNFEHKYLPSVSQLAQYHQEQNTISWEQSGA